MSPPSPPRPPGTDLDTEVESSRLVGLTGGNLELLEDIVGELEESANQLVASIGAALEREDAEEVMIAAHTLKGSSGMVGAHGLRRVSEAMEHAAATGDLEAARRLLGPLGEARSAAITALRAAVGRTKGA